MTKIAVKGADTGTGTFTLKAPVSNEDRELLLPDEAGELLTNASDIASERMKDGLNASGDAPIYACRAWVNFDGMTTPPTIRASGNVSSVIKNAGGVYTINFETDMADSGYSIAGMYASLESGNLNSTNLQLPREASRIKTPASFNITVVAGGAATQDSADVSISVFQ